MVSRTYTSTDSYLLETSYMLHGLFKIDIADFADFNTIFNQVYADDWLATIDIIEGVLKDSTIKDQLAQHSERVKKLMAMAGKEHRMVQFFAKAAFGKQQTVLNELGKSSYRTVRHSQGAMLIFLDTMYHVCLKYAAELGAVGLDSGRIAAIKVLERDLEAAVLAQQSFKKSRKTLTEQRVRLLNACYRYTQEVSKAAAVIYSTQSAKARQYQYYLNGQHRRQIVTGDKR